MLTEEKCTVCQVGDIPLAPNEVEEYMKQVDSAWENLDNHKIKRVFELEDWKAAQEFTDKVGFLAEEEGHHPVIQLEWGKVTVTLWTHKIDGLFKNDFILAAKIDKL